MLGAVATWGEFERADGGMAQRGRALLLRHQVAYLATIRPDGGPRVHHVCPAIAGHELYVSIGPRSPKLGDLRRDGRYMLHFMCGERDAEFSVRGKASELTDAAEQAAVRTAANAQGIRFTEHEVLFRLSIDRADATEWEHFGTPQIRPRRTRWLAP
jgi:hypothetical protein